MTTGRINQVATLRRARRGARRHGATPGRKSMRGRGRCRVRQARATARSSGRRPPPPKRLRTGASVAVTQARGGQAEVARLLATTRTPPRAEVASPDGPHGAAGALGARRRPPHQIKGGGRASHIAVAPRGHRGSRGGKPPTVVCPSLPTFSPGSTHDESAEASLLPRRDGLREAVRDPRQRERVDPVSPCRTLTAECRPGSQSGVSSGTSRDRQTAD
jgi:hypothetical protein